MPGTNAGTGCPLNFGCPICRRGRYLGNNRYEELPGFRATGRTKPIPKSGNTGGARMVSWKAEYTCLGCGRKGWSRHIDVSSQLVLPFESKHDYAAIRESGIHDRPMTWPVQ